MYCMRKYGKNNSSSKSLTMTANFLSSSFVFRLTTMNYYYFSNNNNNTNNKIVIITNHIIDKMKKRKWKK